MSKIIAASESETLIIEKLGEHITITLNGEAREDLLPYLDSLVAQHAPYGGTFYPRKGSMTGYLLALQAGAHFQEQPIIRTEGRISKIPMKSGAVY
ncbi:MAG: hypothetical protein IKV82_06930 [Akkermansia sp.]|nr:hypothetical protein [Akkermansia sp.]